MVVNLFPNKDPGMYLYEYLFYKLVEVPCQIVWHHLAHRRKADIYCDLCERLQR